MYCKRIPLESLHGISEGFEIFKPGNQYLILDAGGNSLYIKTKLIKCFRYDSRPPTWLKNPMILIILLYLVVINNKMLSLVVHVGNNEESLSFDCRRISETAEGLVEQD